MSSADARLLKWTNHPWAKKQRKPASGIGSGVITGADKDDTLLLAGFFALRKGRLESNRMKKQNILVTLKVGVPPVINEVLKLIAGQDLARNGDPNQGISMVILGALANWHLLVPHINALTAYCEREGENQVAMLYRAIDAQKRLMRKGEK